MLYPLVRVIRTERIHADPDLHTHAYTSMYPCPRLNTNSTFTLPLILATLQSPCYNLPRLDDTANASSLYVLVAVAVSILIGVCHGISLETVVVDLVCVLHICRPAGIVRPVQRYSSDDQPGERDLKSNDDQAAVQRGVPEFSPGTDTV